MAKYDLNNEFKREMFQKRVTSLLNSQFMAELTKIDTDKIIRKLDQNGLYWVWLACLEKETGYEKNQFHVLFRGMFLRRPDTEVLEIIKPKVWDRIKTLIDAFHYDSHFALIIDLISKSTTELTIGEFAKYLTKIKEYAAINMSVTLINKDEQHFKEFYNEYFK